MDNSKSPDKGNASCADSKDVLIQWGMNPADADMMSKSYTISEYISEGNSLHKSDCNSLEPEKGSSHRDNYWIKLREEKGKPR